MYTDAFVRAWVPSDKASAVTIVTFANAAGGTQYRLEAAHWSAADRARHAATWAQQGWGAAGMGRKGGGVGRPDGLAAPP